MAATWRQTLNDVLGPTDRIAEITFGVLMAITMTAAVNVGADGSADMRELIVGALGCNLAWGIVDAVMYLVNAQVQRNHRHKLLAGLRAEVDTPAFPARIAELLPERLADTLTDDTIARMRAAVRGPHAARPGGWPAAELAAAVLICLLVFVSTLPLVVPLLLVDDPRTALRASHATAIAMLFCLGWRLGDWGGRPPAMSGFLMAAIGVLLAGICILLGG